jgi:hypothetical protein
LAVIIADTDVLIDFLIGAQPVANQIVEYIKTEQIQTTAVTSFELFRGADESTQGQAVRRLIDALHVLPLDREARGGLQKFDVSSTALVRRSEWLTASLPESFLRTACRCSQGTRPTFSVLKTWSWSRSAQLSIKDMLRAGASPKVCRKQMPLSKSQTEPPMPRALMTQRLKLSVQMPCKCAEQKWIKSAQNSRHG